MSFNLSLALRQTVYAAIITSASLLGEEIAEHPLTHLLLVGLDVVRLLTRVLHRLLELLHTRQQLVDTLGGQRAAELHRAPVADDDIFVVDLHLRGMLLGRLGLDM